MSQTNKILRSNSKTKKKFISRYDKGTVGSQRKRWVPSRAFLKTSDLENVKSFNEIVKKLDNAKASIHKDDFYIKGYIRKLEDQKELRNPSNFGYVSPYKKVPDFTRSIVGTRNHIRFRLWKLGRNIEDTFAEHPGMTEEEHEKIEQALDIIKDLTENWNEGTFKFKTETKI